MLRRCRRQWNGRLGKVDNCQVGVFAAWAHGETACLIDAELFLTEDWVADAGRCAEAGIAEAARIYRSKAQIALDLVRRARRNGLTFDGVAADDGSGHLPWFLCELDDEGERFSSRSIPTRRSISRIRHRRCQHDAARVAHQGAR